MNKTLALLPLFLFACSGGCGGHEPSPNPPPSLADAGALPIQDAAPADSGSEYWKYSNSFFEITLPNYWHVENPPIRSAHSYFTTPRNNGAAFLAAREPFEKGINEFALLSVRAAKESGMDVSSSLSVEINDTKFFKMLLIKDSSMFWIWLTVKDGYAHTFGCKTQDLPEDKSAAVCESIAQSLILL